MIVERVPLDRLRRTRDVLDPHSPYIKRHLDTINYFRQIIRSGEEVDPLFVLGDDILDGNLRYEALVAEHATEAPITRRWA